MIIFPILNDEQRVATRWGLSTNQIVKVIVGCTPTNVPLWEIPIYISPISTMGTLLGVHPIVPLQVPWTFLQGKN